MSVLNDLPPVLYRVARLTVDGHSRGEIAELVKRTPGQVEKMRTTIYREFNVANRYELAKLVPDAKLKPPKVWPCSAHRQSLSLRYEEMLALHRVLSAAENGQDVRVMTRDKMYLRARGVLIRAGETARRKLAAATREAV